MNIEEARRFALSLPGTTEAPHFEKSSFRVGGKIFATVPEGGRHLHVMVGEDEARAAVEEGVPGCELLTWGKRVAGVRVTLADAPADRIRELVEDAHRSRAPKRSK